VAEALDGHDVFVEDLFFALLDRLGLDTAEVAEPSPPATVDVLRGLFGHRLEAVDLAAHRPVRGERLAYGEMPDLRLHFEGRPTVTACSCGGTFVLLPGGDGNDGRSIPNAQAVAEVAGRPLTDAATVRHRFLPFVRGVVLRFGDAAERRDQGDQGDQGHRHDPADRGDRDLFIVALDGRWTVANGSGPPQDLLAELGPGRTDEIHVNPWLAS
jgi:hypothetical protein